MSVEKCPYCGRMCRKRDGLYFCPSCENVFRGKTVSQRLEEGFNLLTQDYSGDESGDRH